MRWTLCESSALQRLRPQTAKAPSSKRISPCRSAQGSAQYSVGTVLSTMAMAQAISQVLIQGAVSVVLVCRVRQAAQKPTTTSNTQAAPMALVFRLLAASNMNNGSVRALGSVIGQ